jgi:diguanylate cyclase (GGDEF)-like protein
MSDERRQADSVGARMRAQSTTGDAWGVWGRRASDRGGELSKATNGRRASDHPQDAADGAELSPRRSIQDAVTGLPNRLLFLDRLDGAIKRARRNRQSLALALIEIEDIARVDEMHGPNAGNELMVLAARRMEHAVRESDTIARIGSHHFAVVFEALHNLAAVELLGSKLVAALSQPCTLLVDTQGTPLEIVPVASIGIAIHPASGTDVDELIGAAEMAKYQAKREGGLRVHRPSGIEPIRQAAGAP